MKHKGNEDRDAWLDSVSVTKQSDFDATESMTAVATV